MEVREVGWMETSSPCRPSNTSFPLCTIGSYQESTEDSEMMNQTKSKVDIRQPQTMNSVFS